MRISIIAAMASNRVIGRDGRMPWHLPAELRYFKLLTLGKPIVMGRRTFESIGRVLPGRRNIVITREQGWQFEGVDVMHNIDDALEAAGNEQEIMIIGGAELYRQMLYRVQRLYLTLIDADIEGDTYFPPFKWEEWKRLEKSYRAADEKNAYAMEFLILERKLPMNNQDVGS